MHRLTRFGLFPSSLAGFTRLLGCEVQFLLDVLPLVALEIHVLLASPLVRAFDHRSRLGLSVAPPFGIGVPHELRRRRDLLCPMLTSAPRSGCFSAASVTEVTRADLL